MTSHHEEGSQRKSNGIVEDSSHSGPDEGSQGKHGGPQPTDEPVGVNGIRESSLKSLLVGIGEARNHLRTKAES